ncbi:hypothetical protein FISHEDRAFT_7922, partial [Fistulina hepatica ATCC 64428]
AALASVPVSTICKWEHRMWRWVKAYCKSMNAKDAQHEVKKFSSCKYASHHCVPETCL